MPRRLEWARPESWRPFIAGALERGIAGHTLVQELRATFLTLRSFHSARPVDVASYYRNGILPLTRAGWHALVAECFLSNTTDPVVITMIARARDLQFELVQDGGVHFCCDERLILELDTYQLIHGSLSLLVVAARTDKACGTDLKSALRRRGRPAVFVCDVPFALISDDVVAELVAGLMAHDPTSATRPWDFRYEIQSALPPTCVIDHYEPRCVPDLVYGHHIAPAG
jgi:hypothetical protein